MVRQFLLLLNFFQFILIAHLHADNSYWDTQLVRAYVHNSELQRRWAFAFLAPRLMQLKGNEYILDVGCGDGKITADVSKFIPEGNIVGIDPSTPMLDWAQKQYCAIEYPNLKFQEGGFLEPNTTDSFDVVISHCALQHCPNQSKAIENLAKLLKAGGKLWVMVPAIDNSAWKQAFKNVQKREKWSPYWKNAPCATFLNTEKYIELLQNVDLYPQKVEKIQTADPFVNREEFLTFLLGTFTPAVPRELAEEFFNEIIDEYLFLLPEAMQPNGIIEARYSRIEIEAIYLPA